MASNCFSAGPTNPCRIVSMVDAHRAAHLLGRLLGDRAGRFDLHFHLLGVFRERQPDFLHAIAGTGPFEQLLQARARFAADCETPSMHPLAVARPPERACPCGKVPGSFRDLPR
jgi:hypothetical protein